MDINCDCQFCANHLKGIDHPFIHFIREIRFIIAVICPIHIKSDLRFLDWINHIKKYENVYNKSYDGPLQTSYLLFGLYGYRTIYLEPLMSN